MAAPNPFPAQMQGPVDHELQGDEMEGLSSNARYIIRRLVADAYAAGHQDGRVSQQQSEYVDRVVARAAADKAAKVTG